MGNFNLPPGCTDADVDRAMGGYDECYHEDYDIDILTGRAHCHICGEPFWPTDDDIRALRRQEAAYDKHCRRYEREVWWREFRQRWFWRPTFPIRWAVDAFLHKCWPKRWGRRNVTAIAEEDEIPF